MEEPGPSGLAAGGKPKYLGVSSQTAPDAGYWLQPLGLPLVSGFRFGQLMLETDDASAYARPTVGGDEVAKVSEALRAALTLRERGLHPKSRHLHLVSRVAPRTPRTDLRWDPWEPGHKAHTRTPKLRAPTQRLHPNCWSLVTGTSTLNNQPTLVRVKGCCL